MDVAARMTAGDQVELRRENGSLYVHSLAGEYVGEIEPKLGQRLTRLMDGGNQYVAAISSLGESEVKVFIRETFQHASQTGKLSFPPTITESFRPYVKERLLRQDSEEDTYYDEGEESEDWEGPAEGDETDVTIYDFERRGRRASIDVEVEDEEEE
jgi:hypothetical protein